MEAWNVCFASILPECSFGANIMQFLVQVLESSLLWWKYMDRFQIRHETLLVEKRK